MSAHELREEFSADVETKDCERCMHEFVPTVPDQRTCRRRACAGAEGASKRDYRAKRSTKDKAAAKAIRLKRTGLQKGGGPI